MTRTEILMATRADLVTYLESWGDMCYDAQTTEELRVMALENAI